MKKLLCLVAIAALISTISASASSAQSDFVVTEDLVAAAEAHRHHEQRLAEWSEPGVIEEVNSSWTCLVGSYHHTCTTWVYADGTWYTCPASGCNPFELLPDDPEPDTTPDLQELVDNPPTTLEEALSLITQLLALLLAQN